MNREQASKIWPFVKAFGEGKEIGIDEIRKRDTDNLNFSLDPKCYSILPDKKVVDLSKVAGSAIPMLFGDTVKSINTPAKLLKINSADDFPFKVAKDFYKCCEFDTSENNWVSWGPHLPEYDGECPLPDGVKFTVVLRTGLKVLHEYIREYSDVHWEHDDDDAEGDIIAYRVVGLLPDYCYEHGVTE